MEGALGLTFSCTSLIRLEQSDSRHVGCCTQSATKRRPSKHASASACSADAQPRITLQADRMTFPAESRMTTPTLAVPHPSQKAASVFSLTQPSIGFLHFCFATFLTSSSGIRNTTDLPCRHILPFPLLSVTLCESWITRFSDSQ
jgi:hypothetical protein